MIINQQSLLTAAPIVDMAVGKQDLHGVSHGLSEAGYDIRIKQDVVLHPLRRFRLASTIERFEMPDNMIGVVHDKSSWARQKLSVFNTIIEPGWGGWLTLELMYHGWKPLRIAAGSGIAQVLFHEVKHPFRYEGKYNNQPDRPVSAIFR